MKRAQEPLPALAPVGEQAAVHSTRVTAGAPRTPGRAAVALRESEELLRVLFEHSDQGCCVLEKVEAGDGKPADFIYVAANPAMHEICGVQGIAGSTVRELFPAEPESWFEIFDRVLATGKARRFEHWFPSRGKLLDVHAFRFPGSDRRLGVALDDITARRNCEETLRDDAGRRAYLLALSDSLRQAVEPGEILAVALRMLVRQIGASHAWYAGCDAGGSWRVQEEHARAGVSGWRGQPLRLAEFGPGYERLAAGQVLVASRTVTPAADSAGGDALAVAVAPLLQDGRLTALFGVCHEAPRCFTPPELSLIEETAARTIAAVDRAAAEARLREGETRYRTLFESMDQGYVLAELIRNELDAGIDYRYLEINPAWERLVGLPAQGVVGRTRNEVVPYCDPALMQTFTRVVDSGQPIRCEHYSPYFKRWYDINVCPRGGDRFVLLYDEITERKRQQANLAFLSELGEALSGAVSEAQLMTTAGEWLGPFLGITLLLLVEYEAQSDQPRAAHAWRGRRQAAQAGYPPAAGVQDAHAAPEAWRPTAVNDAVAEPLVMTYAQLGMRGYLQVPLSRDATETTALVVARPDAGGWRGDEVDLLREVAQRLSARRQRLRAEEALRDSEASHSFMLRLADALRWLRDAAQVRATGCQMLLEQIRPDRVIYADIVEDAQYVVRCCRGAALPDDALAGPADYFGATVAQAGGRGDELVVGDVATDPRFSDAERTRLQAAGIGAFLAFMVVRQGRWVGMFGVHSASAREWTRPERTVARMVGDRLWSAARRAAAEAALRESEARFRALADASPAFIWQIDTDGQAVYLNRRYVEDTGLSQYQLRGTGWHRVVHPDDLRDYLATVEAALRRREPFQKRVRARLRDGSWHWFDTHAMPWFADDGEYRGHVGISIDITEAVRAEESLRDADRRKDEFLAILAHELRNPLAPISNAVHLLRHEDGRRRADQLVDMVGRQVRQVVRLVDDLMEVSRITRGKIGLERKPVALAEVLTAAIETSQPAIELARHQFEVALSDEALVVDGDRVRLVQVFTNLLNNAAKYTDRGGAIRLVARREGDWAVVSVRDTGIGIHPEQLAKVFDMFVQVRGEAQRSQGGLGIGLTMVRNLVDMHGGDVRAYSAGLGCGSVFTVRLPLLSPGEATLAPAPAGDSVSLAGRSILVVDDNRDAADSLALLLESKGAHVLAAYDGPACLAVLERERPDTLLLDIGMPGMSGHEVARRIRQDTRLTGLRIIALTGWGQLADREQSRLNGIDEHLTKPVDLDLLEARLLLQCRPDRPCS